MLLLAATGLAGCAAQTRLHLVAREGAGGEAEEEAWREDPRLYAVPGQPTPANLAPGTDIGLGGTNEPALAIDPGNPLRLAYASAIQLRVSVDGGASFAPDVWAQVPANHNWAGDSQVAYDSQGRLFWVYIGFSAGGGTDLLLARCDPTSGQILPGYPISITESAGLNRPGASGLFHDKEWLAIDTWPASPYRDRIHIAWVEIPVDGSPRHISTTHSDDQGATWSQLVALSQPSDGYVQVASNAVAPDGDVYVAYHSQAVRIGRSPDGLSGKTVLLRSADGGVTFPDRREPFAAGSSDITFNFQNEVGPIPGAPFLTLGSLQVAIVPDPLVPDRVLVFAVDDPDNDHTSGDDSHVYMAESLDDGRNFAAPRRIDQGSAGTYQVFPMAIADAHSGQIVVVYYDNRRGVKNTSGDDLLDLWMARSVDGGRNWGPEVQVNDLPFDTRVGAPVYDNGPPATLRMGEYVGLAALDCIAHVVWTGNTRSPGGAPLGQQSVFDRVDDRLTTGTLANRLRAVRRGLDVELSWPAFAVEPPRYNLHRTADKSELDRLNYLAPAINVDAIGSGGWTDVGAAPVLPTLLLYEVQPRKCDGSSAIE